MSIGWFEIYSWGILAVFLYNLFQYQKQITRAVHKGIWYFMGLYLSSAITWPIYYTVLLVLRIVLHFKPGLRLTVMTYIIRKYMKQ